MTTAYCGRAFLLALLISMTACSFDSLIGSGPTAALKMEKATVEPSGEPAQSVAADKPKESPLPLPAPAPVAAIDPVTAAAPISPASIPLPQEQPRISQRDGRDRTLVPSPDVEYRNAVLAEDTVWRGEVQINGWLTVPQQVTVTVEPGTVVRFNPDDTREGSGAGLLVQGRIVAVGSPDRQILFTGRYAHPEEGDWRGVVLLATEKKNLLEQCRIEGAEVALDGLHAQVTLRDVTTSSCRTAFRFRDSYVNAAGGAISRCGVGIESVNSELELKDINLSSNRQGGAVSGGSLYLSGATFYGNSQSALVAERCTVKITGCSFTVNGTGIILTGAEGAVSSNRVLSNRTAGIVLTDSHVRVNANNISQNSSVGLRVSGAGSVIWGNVIAANNGHDLEYSGDADLAAMGNWWGEAGQDRIQSRIRNGDSAGRVLLFPLLAQRPLSVQ